MFYKKVVFTNFAVFTEKHLESFFTKVAGLIGLVGIRIQNSCFPENIAKFSTTILKNICEMLLLDRYINVPLNEIDAHKMKYLLDFSLIVMKNAAFLEFYSENVKNTCVCSHLPRKF